MQKRIELLEELNNAQKQFLQWIFKYDKDILQSLRGIDHFNKVSTLEQQLASLPKEQSVSDEDIEKWANDDIADHWKHGGGVEYDLIYNARIRGAKAMRDNKIKSNK